MAWLWVNRNGCLLALGLHPEQGIRPGIRGVLNGDLLAARLRQWARSRGWPRKGLRMPPGRKLGRLRRPRSHAAMASSWVSKTMRSRVGGQLRCHRSRCRRWCGRRNPRWAFQFRWVIRASFRPGEAVLVGDLFHGGNALGLGARERWNSCWPKGLLLLSSLPAAGYQTAIKRPDKRPDVARCRFMGANYARKLRWRVTRCTDSSNPERRFEQDVARQSLLEQGAHVQVRS